TASKAGVATLWQGGRRIQDFRLDRAELFSASFSPDGARIIAASANGSAGIWNAQSGELLVILKGRAGPCRTALFSAERPEVLTACGTTVQVWDSTTYQLLKEVDNGVGTLNAVFAPGRRSVLIVTQRKPFVYRWDLDGGKLVEFKFIG